MQHEPVYAVSAITALVSAVLSAVVAFGFELSAEQVATILGAVNAILVIVAGVITRSIVWAPATVDEVLHPGEGA